MKYIKKYGGVVVLVFLIVITAWYIFKDQNMFQLLQIITKINIKYIFAGFGLMFLFVFFEALASRTILRKIGNPVRLRQCLGYSFVGFYFSSVTPSSTGGQPAQVYFMTKDDIPVSHATLDMVLITITYQLASLILGLTGIFFIPNFESIDKLLKGLLIVGTITTSVFTVIMILILILPIKNERFLEYKKCSKLIQTNPLLFLKVLLLSCCQLTCLYLVPYMVYLALNLSGFTLIELFAIQATMSLAISILPFPGSVGIAETTFVSVFVTIFSQNLVTPAMLLSRGISFYSFLLVSGIITLILYITHKNSNNYITQKMQVPWYNKIVK